MPVRRNSCKGKRHAAASEKKSEEEQRSELLQTLPFRELRTFSVAGHCLVNLHFHFSWAICLEVAHAGLRPEEMRLKWCRAFTSRNNQVWLSEVLQDAVAAA
eukprot:s1597_g4.t1